MPKPNDNFAVIQATLKIEANEPAPDVGPGTQTPKNPHFTLAAYNGGPMCVAGWRHPVVVDLQGCRVAHAKLPVYTNHEQNVESLLGQTQSVDIVDGRLAAHGEITGRSATCQAVIEHSKNGFEWQASIGCGVDTNEFLAEGKTAIVNGRSVSGPVNIARKSTLGEISFVALGADTSTSAKIAAAAAKETQNMKFNEWLKAEFNLDADKLDAEQTAKFQAKFTASQEPAGRSPVKPVVAKAADGAPAPDPVADIRAKTAAEYDRIGKLQTIAGKHPAVLAKAIGENWDAERTTSEVKLADLQASRAPAGAPALQGGYALTEKAITAAAMLSCGVDDNRLFKDKTFDEATIEAGRKLVRAGALGPVGIMQLAARMEGRELPIGRVNNEWIRAAFSTLSLPNILSNLQNKLLLDGYNSVDQAWRMIAKRGPLNDFKIHTRVRLTSDMMFETLGPDGEIKHGQLAEQAYTLQAITYAKMLSITRQMIINDDLSAMQDQPTQLGIGAADKINDMFWSTFLNNRTAGAAFFPTNNANANYASGAGSALTFDGLTALWAQFLKQTKPNGRPLGWEPEILLVPSDLAVRAEQLTGMGRLIPQLVTALAANSGTPDLNTFTNKFRVVATPFLNNAQYAGGSATAWYLLINPQRLHLIEVGFLGGQEIPVIERAEADFDTLGVEFRGFFDFGVGCGEYRSAAMSAGV